MKKYLLLFFLLLFSVGCKNSLEIEHLAFLSTLAIDYNNGKYEVILQEIHGRESSIESTEHTSIFHQTACRKLKNCFQHLSTTNQFFFYQTIETIIIHKDIYKDISPILTFLVDKVNKNAYLFLTDLEIFSLLENKENFHSKINQVTLLSIEKRKRAYQEYFIPILTVENEEVIMKVRRFHEN